MFPTRRITTGGDKFRNDNSIFLDGVDDYIHVNTNNMFSVSTGDFNTVSIWIKIDSDTNATGRLWNAGASNPGLMIQKGSTNTELGYNTGNAERLGVEIPNSQFYGKWVNIIMSFERNDTTTLPASDSDTSVAGQDVPLNNSSTGQLHPLLWIDGVRQSVSYVSTATSSNVADLAESDNFYIASNNGLNSNNSQPIKGRIADVAVYKGIKFTNSMAKTVYNNREPFDHADWSVGAKYLSMWTACGGADQDVQGSYGLMTDLIADDASSAASNGANLYSDDSSEFAFNVESIASQTDGYDLVANSLIGQSNASVLTEHASDGTRHAVIQNTANEYGTANISVTCEPNTKYRFLINYRPENGSHSTHNLKLAANAASATGSGGNMNVTVGTTSNQVFGRRIVTGASQTTLTFNFGPNSNTINSRLAIYRFRLNKINNLLALENKANNTSSLQGVGTPTIEGDSPFGR